MHSPVHSREFNGSAMLTVPSAMDNKSAEEDAATTLPILIL
jgi:hypothetical protein